MRGGNKNTFSVCIHLACLFVLEGMPNLQKAQTAMKRARARYRKKRTKKNYTAYTSALLALVAVGVATVVASSHTKRRAEDENNNTRNKRSESVVESGFTERRADERRGEGHKKVHRTGARIASPVRRTPTNGKTGECKKGFRKDTKICSTQEKGIENYYCVQIPDNGYCYSPCGHHRSNYNHIQNARTKVPKISKTEQTRRLKKWNEQKAYRGRVVVCAKCKVKYYSVSGTTTICPECR